MTSNEDVRHDDLYIVWRHWKVVKPTDGETLAPRKGLRQDATRAELRKRSSRLVQFAVGTCVSMQCTAVRRFTTLISSISAGASWSCPMMEAICTQEYIREYSNLQTERGAWNKTTKKPARELPIYWTQYYIAWSCICNQTNPSLKCASFIYKVCQKFPNLRTKSVYKCLCEFYLHRRE
jgi:hypothetical protein